MKKCIIIPDSFKGTLTSMEICKTIKDKVSEHFPSCKTISLPIADGGEGMADCFLYALNAQKVTLQVKNAYNELIEVYYAKKEHRAFIEVAQVVGLPQVEGRKNPLITTTYGVGEMIKHAVEHGCTDIIIGLGGSCTNDGGTGAACALGTVFKNKQGETFLPTGGSLKDIVSIDNSQTQELLKNCSITAMCDVDNPMYGQTGAAYIFAPQKGADENMVKVLDENLRMLSQVILKELNLDVSNLPGTGAAGAFGAGIVAFFGGKLKSGIETILDVVNFDEVIKGADMIFTGEGMFDRQSLHGKVVIGVASRAKKQNIPVTAIVGSIGEGIEEAYNMGLGSIFSINQRAEDFSVSRYHSKENLEATMDSLLRFYKLLHFTGCGASQTP